MYGLYGAGHNDFDAGKSITRARVMDLPASIQSKCHIKNRYIGYFMYMKFCILYCMLWVLCASVLLQLCRVGAG